MHAHGISVTSTTYICRVDVQEHAFLKHILKHGDLYTSSATCLDVTKHGNGTEVNPDSLVANYSPILEILRIGSIENKQNTVW